VVRTLQDLTHLFSRDRRALVLTAPRVELPSELAALASLVKLELPTEADLRTLAQEVFGSLARLHKLGPPPGPDILDKIAGALRGLTLFEAERALTRAVLDDLTLGPRDIEVIAEMKKELLSRDLPTLDERRQIFGVHLGRRHRDPAAYDLVALAEAAHGFSGAEIEQAVVSALYTAFARGAELATEHILEEIKATKPLSVTRAEDVEALREWARGRAVPAA
jgi:hypothetical protein